MFLTSTVPARLPSDFHSSTPWVPSSAEKNTRPPTSVNEWGYDSRPPGAMFLTRTVPARLPSDFHSSSPWVPSLTTKNNRPPTSVREEGPP